MPFWLSITFTVLYGLTILTLIIVVLSENRNPIRSLAWVLALAFLPGVGLLFYLFFGRSMKGRHMISRHNKRKLMRHHLSPPVDLNALDLPPSRRQLVKMARQLCHAPLTLNNTIEVFTDGVAKFDSLKRDLRNARQSILLQYYIFQDDKLGNEIADILIERARAGVMVKVIYDHVGSFGASRAFFKRMKAAGIDTHPFFRVTFPQLANRINWRNHRKLVVIDGTIGYIGGMNIADRYLGTPIPKGLKRRREEKRRAEGGVWRDTHFRLTGDIVETLVYSFAIDWNFMKKTPRFVAPHCKPSPHRNNVGVQMVASGPMEPYDNLSMMFLKAITCARRSVYIQTPYFLPTESLLRALEIAAMSQVDVRVMIPERSDSHMLQLASYSYVTQCLRAGIKVYFYEPGMLHAKVIVIDNDLVTAGSTNFDFRSLENNFECNLVVYDPAFNARMRDIFFTDLAHCRKITLTDWQRRPRLQRALESLVRLLAPIL